jgi:hypothetical protein
MNLIKSMFYTFGSFVGISVGIIAVILGLKDHQIAGLICGVPTLLIGLIFLVLAFRHINIDYD